MEEEKKALYALETSGNGSFLMSESSSAKRRKVFFLRIFNLVAQSP